MKWTTDDFPELGGYEDYHTIEAQFVAQMMGERQELVNRYYDFIDSLTHGDPSRLFQIAASLGWKQKQFDGDLTGEWVSAAKWGAARLPFPQPPEATP